MYVSRSIPPTTASRLQTKDASLNNTHKVVFYVPAKQLSPSAQTHDFLSVERTSGA